MFVDERHHFFPGQSSSAWAKKSDALRKISLARRSSRFSRSSGFSLSRSSLVTPAPAWRTHFRNVYVVQPIFAAIEAIAAHRS
jgi:hypothetical protein